MGPIFPFSAIVGQEEAKQALLLGVIDPGIGGVLLFGEKGTGKTTLVRALASLVPGMPLVELPLNATEDRLVGSLNVEKALSEGVRQFEPGLLAAAHGGILYVDEVNLLEHHLVDLLLDVAATGVNRVEREGISYEHPARFLLVGSMNPEEGDLRPQFLDRFGLAVPVRHLEDPDLRAEVVRRRLAFESDPEGFVRAWREEDALASQVAVARERLRRVGVAEEVYAEAVRIAGVLGARGHRAELVMVRAARALAAFLERDEADTALVRAVARYALVHRVRIGPGEREDAVLRRIDAAVEGREGEREVEGEMVEPEDAVVPGAAAAGSLMFEFVKKKLTRWSTSR
ncbi:ATP-binding protein [Spirochaeta thermophila]|uniref:AAA+ ATPase domain-containing protein n=1 Tax=Winmispira thermophila (strain ATCC 49972 / DSM 6192 / RI 19.B1) TaxID=665571 RepID=E0RU74_WINT6|nr:ATP-binding protein [Spirochaeta thermophila]ADN02295.1 hypothetical protein STHERM_c13550 [Spirochaeta thermophila DSM 6192]